MKTIGIVGGGASGTLAALHCKKTLNENIQILIFEPSEKLGRGNAYAHHYDDYILNVPVNNMSVFPDHPDDFEKWILQFKPEIAQSRDWPFVPRYYFGLYLDDHLSKMPHDHLQHIRTKVSKIDMLGRQYQLRLANHKSFLCDYLILATGYEHEPPFPHRPCLKNLTHRVFSSENYHHTPLSQFSGRVLILGTGLTGIDVWRKLKQNEGLKITFFSRRGFLPLEQDLSTPRIKFPTLFGMSPLQILQVLRAIQSNHELSWVTIANHVRPQAQKIWTCWTEAEKKQFLKYLKPYWEVIRHRMPSSVFADLQKDLCEKRAEVKAGKMQKIQLDHEHFNIEYIDRKSNTKQTFQANYIIYANGLPINQALLDTEHFLPGLSLCPYGMGYVNQSAPRLWVIGPASKGMFWENVAIPDIREQAKQIAEDILSVDKIQHLRTELFLVHPHSAKESYWLHFKKSTAFSLFLFKSMWFAFVHACFPFLYTDKISSRTRDLAYRLTKRRKKTTHEEKQKRIQCTNKLTV